MWAFETSDPSFRPAHANDGPTSAWVELVDGARLAVAVSPMRRAGERAATDAGAPGPAASGPAILDSAAPAPAPAIVPWPNEVALAPGDAFAPDALVVAPGSPDALFEEALAVERTRAMLFPDEPPIYRADASPAGSDRRADRRVALTSRDGAAGGSAGGAAEGYRIEFGDAAVEIVAAARAGLHRALVALAQAVRGARADAAAHPFPPPGSRIVDAPHHGWRGVHLDVARRFRTVAEVERVIALASWYRLNRFHWHLTDDEAWRLESRAYPELTDIAATRGPGRAIPSQHGDGVGGHAGAYTRDDVARVVRFAAERHVDVVPEIDLPAHCTAALRALPGLADPAEAPGGYVSVHGYANNALNPAMPAARAFADTVVDELVALFPGPVVHLGGDEVAEGAWRGSPAARALADSLGLADTAALQGRFLAALRERVNGHGRTLAVWDDGVGADWAPGGVIATVWRDAALGDRLAARGFDVVMTPAQAFYLDMACSTDWDAPGASWAGASSLADAYAFDATLDAARAHRLLGVQAGIWAEHLREGAMFDALVLERLAAIAEQGWTAPGERSWARFAAALGVAGPSRLLCRSAPPA